MYIRNWHLAVPGWSKHGGSGSTNKGQWKVERQLENEARGWKAREDRVREERESRKLDLFSSDYFAVQFSAVKLSFALSQGYMVASSTIFLLLEYHTYN